MTPRKQNTEKTLQDKEDMAFLKYFNSLKTEETKKTPKILRTNYDSKTA